MQDYFVAKLPSAVREPLIQRIVWLMGVAISLDVPIVVTAEDMTNCGSVSVPVTEVLLPDTPVYNKMVFGLAQERQIMAAIEETGRKTAILVGLETVDRDDALKAKMASELGYPSGIAL